MGIWGHLGAILESSWGMWEPCWGHLGASGGILAEMGFVYERSEGLPEHL